MNWRPQQAELQAKYRDLELREEVAAGLLPPRNAIPRNLRMNMFRGGRRPLDLYRRVHQGISGTPMPASGPVAPGAQGTLTEARDVADRRLRLARCRSNRRAFHRRCGQQIRKPW